MMMMMMLMILIMMMIMMIFMMIMMMIWWWCYIYIMMMMVVVMMMMTITITRTRAWTWTWTWTWIWIRKYWFGSVEKWADGQIKFVTPFLDRSLLNKTGFVSVHNILPNIISPIRRVCWSRSHNNSLRPRQNGRLFADDTFKRIFLNENIRISTKNSLKFVPKGLINNIPTSVLIMAWRRPGDKPLSEPMLVRSLTHICVTRPQWE